MLGKDKPSPIQFMLKRVSGVMKPNQFTSIGDLVITPQRGISSGVHVGEATVKYSLDSVTSSLRFPFRYDNFVLLLFFCFVLFPSLARSDSRSVRQLCFIIKRIYCKCSLPPVLFPHFRLY